MRCDGGTHLHVSLERKEHACSDAAHPASCRREERQHGRESAVPHITFKRKMKRSSLAAHRSCALRAASGVHTGWRQPRTSRIDGARERLRFEWRAANIQGEDEAVGAHGGVGGVASGRSCTRERMRAGGPEVRSEIWNCGSATEKTGRDRGSAKRRRETHLRPHCAFCHGSALTDTADTGTPTASARSAAKADPLPVQPGPEPPRVTLAVTVRAEGTTDTRFSGKA